MLSVEPLVTVGQFTQIEPVREDTPDAWGTEVAIPSDANGSVPFSFEPLSYLAVTQPLGAQFEG